MRLAALALAASLAAAPAVGNGVAVIAAPMEIAVPSDAELEFAGAVALRSDDVRFGGLSDLVLDPDGEGFVAVSDAGYWAVGRFLRDAEGRLTGAEIDRYERIRAADGAPMARALRDAEAIAPHPEGGYLVAFERAHRVSHFPEIGAPEGEVFRPAEWRVMNMNGGIESLVALPSGRVYGFKEGRLPESDATPVWRIGGPQRRVARLPLLHHDYVSGAGLGPDGRLYVVERRFGLFSGFRVHVQRYPGVPEDLEEEVRPEHLLTLTAADGSDNFEAIQPWRDPDGRVRLLLLSDDNYNPLQRTIAAEFILRD